MNGTTVRCRIIGQQHPLRTDGRADFLPYNGWNATSSPICPAEGDDEYRLLIYDGHKSHITYEFIEYAYAIVSNAFACPLTVLIFCNHSILRPSADMLQNTQKL